MYLGIDYSLSSPAICIQSEDHCFFKSEYHYLTDKKRLIGKIVENIHGWEHQDYKTEEQRYENIATWVLDRIASHDIKKIYIEGYSMGSKGRVFNIGENTGILKYLLYKKDFKFVVIPPTTVKMDFQGKGNSSKDAMMEEFICRTGLDLKKLLGPDRKLGSPETDIVDAWAVVLSGRKITKTTLLTAT